jgi:flagellar hook assembly protein FlgD
MEGQYGSKIFPNINWIAQLKRQECSSVRFANAEEIKTIAPSKNTLSVVPNPFSNSTNISFSLSQSQKVSVQIFDMQGRSIKTLVDAQTEAGTHQLTWNARNDNGSAVVTGIYLLKIQAGNFVETKKIWVVK